MSFLGRFAFWWEGESHLESVSSEDCSSRICPGFAELARAPTFLLDWHDFAADSGPAVGSVDFAFSFLLEVPFVISVSVLFVSKAEFLSNDLEWSARLLACCSETVSVNTSHVATDFGMVCDLY